MKALGRVEDDADAWRLAIDQASSQKTKFPVSRAGDEMTRGKREQRSSGIRGPRKQDPEHGLGRKQCDSDQTVTDHTRVGIPRSIFFLPSIAFMHAMRRHRPLLFSEHIVLSPIVIMQPHNSSKRSQ